MAIDSEKLNKEQKKAVMRDKGPVLIVAGAGTGKTTVITSKIAYLIEKKKIKPEEILAVTFTEKAAGEMTERVDALISESYADLWISTFHSFCERVLRDYGLDIGLAADFKILDETAARILIRQNLEKFNLNYYKPLGNPGKFVNALVSHFFRCKDQEIRPEDYLKFAKTAVPEDKKRIAEIVAAYKMYEKLLLEKKFFDFGDLINYCLKLFKERPAVLEKFRERFKYILVDEFQDTNWSQYKLVKIISYPKNNLTVTADDDQSIYKFRGASFGNVLQFKKDFPKAREIVLVKNYRSFQNILDIAYKFIQSNNPDRLECINGIDKRLVASKNGMGKVLHLRFKTLDGEAQGTVRKIVEILKSDKDANFSDFAILVRANNQASIFSRALERAEIPFQFLALRGLYSKPAVLDIISYLKVLDNYYENSAMYRILNLPFFEIPAEDIARITQYSSRKFKSIYESLQEMILIPGVSPKTENEASKILNLIKKHSELAKNKNVSEVMLAFLENSGYLEHLAKNSHGSLAGNNEEKISHITQFYDKVKEFEEKNIDPKLKNFITELALEIESGEEGKLDFDINLGPDVVKIMTLHAAKGLEFKYVFLVNLVDKKFPTIERRELIEIPNSLIKDRLPKGDWHLQEERRLFYVGITRAKKGVFFTSAEDYGGAAPRKISRFLAELGYTSEIQSLNAKCRTKLGINSPKYKLQNTKYKFALPDHFSFTQLAAFEKCPLQYKFAHILRIPVRGKATFSYGKSLHKTLLNFVYQSTDEKCSFGDLLKIYKECWIDEWFENKNQRDKYYLKGRKSLENFYKKFKRESPEIYLINGKPALEQNFSFRIGKYSIIGKIDRIDRTENGVEIIDYKTGSFKKKVEAGNKTQLLIYQMAAEEVFDLIPEKLTYYFVDEGKAVSFLGTDEDKEKEQKKIIEKIKKIKRSDLRATPGHHCRWCDFSGICEFAENNLH